MFRMPMKHLEALLPEYVRGGLSAEERRAVQWHILACDRCRESLKLIDPVLRERRTPSAPPPEYFTGILPRVRERIARHERTRSAVRTAWTRIVAPLVSTLAVIAMVLTISPIVEHAHSSARGLTPLISSLTADELSDVLDGQSQQPLFSNVTGHDLTGEAAVEQIAASVPVSAALLAEPSTTGLSESDVEGLVRTLPDENCDALIDHLKERTVL